MHERKGMTSLAATLYLERGYMMDSGRGIDEDSRALSGACKEDSRALDVTVCSRPEYRSNPGARLVLRASKAWGASNHELFPATSRAQVPPLLLLGKWLARETNFPGEATFLRVMSFLICRNDVFMKPMKKQSFHQL